MSSNSLQYLGAVERQPLESLFYTPHLLFQPILLLTHNVLAPFPECSVQCAGQIHSIFWATVAVVCLYLLVVRATQSTMLGLAGAALLLVSHDFWVFGTQLEVYAPLTGCLLLLATLLVYGTRDWSPPIHVAACGIVWALATVYHQAGVVVFLPLSAYLVMQLGLDSWKRIASISILAGGLVLAAYVLAYRAADPATPFLAWTVSLANVPLTDWGSTGHWTLSGLRRGLYSQVSSLAAMPDELSPSQGGLQRRGRVMILALLAWSAFQVMRRSRLHQIRAFLLVWFAAFFLFFVWWDPTVHKFFLPSGPPLVALGILALQDPLVILRRLPGVRRFGLVLYDAAASLSVGMAILAVFAFNLIASIMPLRGDTGPALGPLYYEAEILESIAPSDCVVIGFGDQVLFLSHYFGRTRDRIDTQRNLYERYYFHQTANEGSTPAQRAQGLVGGEPCILTNLYFVSEQRFNSRVTGYIESPDWPAFLEWLFNVEYGRDGSGTHDAFRFVRHSERTPYLLIDRNQRVEGNGRDLADVLASEWDASEQGLFRAFPGRDRELIFGYGRSVNSSRLLGFWPELWRVLRLI